MKCRERQRPLTSRASSPQGCSREMLQESVSHQNIKRTCNCWTMFLMPDVSSLQMSTVQLMFSQKKHQNAPAEFQKEKLGERFWCNRPWLWFNPTLVQKTWDPQKPIGNRLHTRNINLSDAREFLLHSSDAQTFVCLSLPGPHPAMCVLPCMLLPNFSICRTSFPLLQQQRYGLLRFSQQASLQIDYSVENGNLAHQTLMFLMFLLIYTQHKQSKHLRSHVSWNNRGERVQVQS